MGLISESLREDIKGFLFVTDLSFIILNLIFVPNGLFFITATFYLSAILLFDLQAKIQEEFSCMWSLITLSPVYRVFN